MRATVSDQGGGGGRSNDYPVIVIGAGPTGLALANLLGRYGVRCLVVERNETTVQEPRAVSIDDESLRTLQSAGMIDAVLPQVVAGYGSRYLDPKGRCFLEVLPTETLYGYPRRNAFRQPILESQLREGLARFPHVEAAFGWALVDFDQDAKRVAVRLESPDGGARHLTCDYLVGCDGSWSAVRTKLGFSLEGETFSEKWLIIDLENSPTSERDTLVFCDAERPCIALPGPGQTRRFEFKLLPGETPESMVCPDTIAKLLGDRSAAPQSIIRRTTVYTFHARLAPTWQAGRVFLAGDACHLTPPFAGQGMNSGVRDAHNLAWKLAMVTSGRLGPGLLITYQRERRDHVGEMIKLALRMGRIMGPSSRWVGAVTQSFFRALHAWPVARDYFAQMKYKPKPRFRAGFQVSPREGAGAGLVGRLLRQPHVRALDGTQMLLDEVLGDGFALVGITDDPLAFDQATQHPIWKKIGVKRVVVASDHISPFGDLTIVAAPAQALVGQHAPAELVLLVRPDRYVAAAFKLRDIEEMARRVEALAKRTWNRAPMDHDGMIELKP
jgi:3-(3-hydroxy-phenyl)propionate hydroxylase